MRVALAHEYFSQWGGAERVTEVLHEMWPDSPVYTLFVDARYRRALRGWDVRTSWLQSLPLARGWHRALLPLLPRAVESLRVDPVDVLVSSSSAFIKGLALPPGARQVCYCHSPTRYLWDWSANYLAEEVPRALRVVARSLLDPLRSWDRAAATRVDRFVANSEAVRARIRRYYDRDAEVVHPPIDVASYAPRPEREDFYLIVSRLIAYKRVDVAVRAFNELGFRLKIVGEGRDRRRLERLAGENVEFLGRQPDEQLRELLAVSRGLIFPAEDDFGIVCVESFASGRPVIAFARGGAREIVDDGRTGILFDAQTPEALIEAVREAERSGFDPVVLRRSAERFDTSLFKQRMAAIVTEEAGR
jgi:glycosyltransferase involved in cell wall biosynthesis